MNKKSSFLQFPAERERERQREQLDEEEGAALVPLPMMEPPRKDVVDGQEQEQQQMTDDLQAKQQQQTRTTTTTTNNKTAAEAAAAASWWRRQVQKQLVLTRGVALVITGLVVLAFLVGGGSSSGSWWIHLDYASSFLPGSGGLNSKQQHQRPPHHVPSPEADLVPIPFSCGNGSGSSSSSSGSWTCRRRGRQKTGTEPPSPSPTPSPSPSPSPPVVVSHSSSPVVLSSSKSSSTTTKPPQCPEYFRYIHSDLSPWREAGGITREAVEGGRSRAAFRLVVVDGRAYVETYHRVFQTRDTFTQWGIAQLLARYPGRVPDLDLMFNCEDMPEVRSSEPAPPPLFRYCKDDSTLDIVFPDWSFWGWPEVNIRPWAPLLEEMEAEMSRLPWAEREPYAYWKGNPGVSGDRRDLLRCNSSAEAEAEWGARVFWQDWGAASRAGFRDSNLAKQCRYRYKIYVRGRSWSVSQKYILACDSPVLLLATPFKDFLSRGLVAGEHYWPIDPADKCPSIKFAVDWGNAHPEQSRRIGQQGSGFARHDLSMDYVYDYMLHLLTEYAKLLRYKPTVPEKAVELCAEAIACPAAADKQKNGSEFDFMMQSREKYVADYEPCTLPPPFTDDEMREMTRKDQEVRANVHKMMHDHFHA